MTTPKAVGMANPIKVRKAKSTLVGAMLKNTKNTKAKGKTTAKKTEPFFEVMDKGNVFEARIQINSNDIKSWLIRFDSEMVSSRHLVPMDDPLRDVRLVNSRLDLFSLINDAKEHEYYDRVDITCPGWDSFIDVLHDYNDKITTVFSALGPDKSLPFHSLPFLLSKDTELSMMERGNRIGFKVDEAKISHSFFGVYLSISGNIVFHDGKQFIPGKVKFHIGQYDGEKTLDELGITFLAQHPDIKTSLIARGKKYFELHSNGPSYVQYVGASVRRSYWSDVNYPSTGRMMVDRLGMTSIDPDYHEYFGMDENSRYRDEDSPVHDIVGLTPTEDQLMVMSPYCYGFSFVSKQWAEFTVSDISQIQFRTDAYSQLMLDTDLKDIMFSLVEYSGEGRDVIDNKGGGCIFLLHGEPGTGKTLSAESIAETLRRPLYMVSVGELGTHVEALDKNLRDILQIAASWNAVLLIDEADIFLEKRDLDVERNALVGVFLRLLEYYSGILFMTTNRVEQIDPAFYARISLGINYPNLTNGIRASIWKTHLKLYDISSLSDKDIQTLSHFELNGRQIKNCVRIVNALVQKVSGSFTIDSFYRVITQIERFNDLLKHN